MFTGFPRSTFQWFSDLEADNSRDYFSARRATYDEHVRGALDELLEELCDETGGRVRMFRQNRDLRFSADKSPYKTTTYGLILDRVDSLAPLYLQLSSGGLFAGSGYYEVAPDQLTRLRDAIVDDATGPALEAAIAGATGAGVELFGAALKTAPRGYPRDHPRVALLRHRALFAGARLAPRGRTGIGRDAALAHARATWSACAPLNAWLDEHVGASQSPRSSSRR